MSFGMFIVYRNIRKHMTVQMYCTRSPSIDFRIRLRVDYVDALHRSHRSLIVNSIFNTSVVISFNLHRHLCCYEQVFFGSIIH